MAMDEGTVIAVAKAAHKAATAFRSRDDAIRAAHADGGHSIRAIAAAAELSPSRVHQILHSR